MKIAIIEISGDFPDTELSKPATITIEARIYTGTVKVIVLGETPLTPSRVTLEGSGLHTVTP